MYAIYSENKIIALTEKPRFIRVNPSNNCLVQTDRKNAQGIVVNSLPYNLPGHNLIMREVWTPTEGGEEGEGTLTKVVAPEAYEVEQSSEDYIFNNRQKGIELDEKNQELIDCILEMSEIIYS